MARLTRHDVRHGSQLIRRAIVLLAAALAVTLTVMATVGPALAGVTGIAVDDPDYAVSEDQLLTVAAPGVLANDGPADPPVKCVDLAHVDVSQLDGSLDINADGSFSFTPDQDFNGSTWFTYKMGTSYGGGCPEGGESNSATVTITVGAVNDPPTVVLDTVCSGGVTVAEDSGPFSNAGRCVEMSDFGPPDENNQSFDAWVVSSTNPGLFSTDPSITPVDGTFGRLQFTPAANASGTSTVTVRGRDSGGTADGGDDLSEPIQFDIDVTPVNDAPTAKADSFFVLRNTTLNVNAPGVLVNDDDIDSTTLTAQKVSNPAHGVVTLAADGSFSYTPASGYTGPDAFSYRGFDGSLPSPTRVVSLTVSGVPPVATPTPVPTAAPPSLAPTPGPTTAEPSASPEVTPSVDPGVSLLPTAGPSASASLEPGATADPGPSGGDGEGVSLPVLLVLLLLVLLVGFGAAVYVPKWLAAQRGGTPMDDA